MYLTHFRLQRHPFSMTPDPAFLYLTNGHREALAALTYAILGRKGFVVLTGEAGTGKTTLIAKVIQSIPSTRVLSSVVLNPTLTPGEFLETILMNLGIAEVPQSKAQRLQFLQGVLLEADKNGKVPVLIVDEAHKVPPDVLEEIRLLSNFEKPESKLIQIVLAGQSELRDILNREDLRQFKQRISMRVEIHALTEPELNNYLQHRWMKAGSVSPHPFSADAMARIARYSLGIPRVVNALCDNALMLAFSRNSQIVGIAEIDHAASELELLTVKSKIPEAQVVGEPASDPPVTVPTGVISGANPPSQPPRAPLRAPEAPTRSRTFSFFQRFLKKAETVS